MILSFNIFVIEITDAAMSLTSIKKTTTKRVPEKENGINKNSKKKEKSFVVMLLN